MCRLKCLENLLAELNVIKEYVPEVKRIVNLLTELNKFLNDKSSNSSTNVEDLFLITILDPLYGFVSILKDATLRKELHKYFIRDFTSAISVLSSDFLMSFSNGSKGYDLIKRVAYLNYATNHIIKTMTDTEESSQNFYYMIIPASSADVRVRDISKLSVEKSKFSIMYVSEKLLLDDIEKTISVICHEISHQVGSIARKREKRYEKITNIIAYKLLYDTTSVLLDDPNNNIYFENITSTLANELAKCWKEQYNHAKKDYYLKTIREFINDTYTFTKMEVVREKEISNLDLDICQKWAEAIAAMELEPRNYICSSLNNYFHTTLFDCFTTDFTMVAQILYDSFSTFCEGISENVDLLDEHTYYCDIVIQAFSEAYSDLQMIKYRNINDFCEYDNILSYVSNVTNSVEDNLRINSIKCLLSDKNSKKINIDSDFYDPIYHITIMNIYEYLLECEKLSSNDINFLPFEEEKWIEKTPSFSH